LNPSDLPLASPRPCGWQVGSAFPSSSETPRLPRAPLRVGMGLGHWPKGVTSSLVSCGLESHWPLRNSRRFSRRNRCRNSPCVTRNSARDVRAVVTREPLGETPGLRRDGAVLVRRKRRACRHARRPAGPGRPGCPPRGQPPAPSIPGLQASRTKRRDFGHGTRTLVEAPRVRPRKAPGVARGAAAAGRRPRDRQGRRRLPWASGVRGSARKGEAGMRAG